MRTYLNILAVLGLQLASVAARAAKPDSAEQSDAASGPRTVLDDAVDVALRQELSGNDVDRNALLRHLVDEDPDFAPARWQLGFLNVGDRWVPYQQLLNSIADRSSRLSEYQQRRATCNDTVADHLLLANVARDRDLRDEERAHLMRIVELDRDNEEAHQRLGDVKVDGFWVAREEADAFARRLLETRRELDAWGPTVDRIVRRLFHSRQAAWESAWAELTAIRDPAAIPAVEAAMAAGDQRGAQWYLTWVRGLDAWEASVALARQAVFAPSAGVRSQAQQALRGRRIDDYVPALLGEMRADPVSSNRLSETQFGGLLYVQHLAFETQNDARERNLAVIYGPEAGIVNINQGTSFRNYRKAALVDSPVLRALALQHLQQHYGTLASVSGGDVATRIQVANGRLARTLAAATGVTHCETPQDWWAWWAGYQQTPLADKKPQIKEDYEESWSVDRQQTRRTRQREGINVRHSCFAAGTLVVTESGPKPIEEIVVGDRVLAQDIDTGQIAFKPVFTTTYRPPSRMLKITTADGKLLCTGGHPFWIDGVGWRYAWELEPGMRFHSIDGSSEIISVEDSGRDEAAYNLVVADFHSYFVGEGRILSHDNSPRSPTNALVPGLMPDWSAPVAENKTGGGE